MKEKQKKHKKRSKREESDSSDSSPDRVTLKIEEKLDEYVQHLRRKRSNFIKNPGEHLLFETEWKNFVAVMKKKNCTDKNNEEFKGEWNKYWSKRLKELDQELITARRAELRRKYRVMDVDELIAKSKRQNKKASSLKPRYLAITTQSQLAGRSKEGKGSIKEEALEASDLLKSKPQVKEAIKESKQTETAPKDETEPPAAVETVPLPPEHPPAPPPPPPESTSESKEADSSPSLLQILRLLTALEDNLGSLGATVTVVLSRVLSVERQQAGSSSSLAHEAVDLIDTCKEKLIGQIEVGLVEGARAKAAQSTVDKISRFLQTVEKPARMPFVPIPVRACPVDMPPLIPVSQEELAEDTAHKPIADSSTSPDGNNNKKETFAQDFSGEELKILLENFAVLNETQKRDLVLYLRRLEILDSSSKASDLFADDSLPLVSSMTDLTVADLKGLGVPVDQIFQQRTPSETSCDASDVIFIETSNRKDEVARVSRDPRLNRTRPRR